MREMICCLRTRSRLFVVVMIALGLLLASPSLAQRNPFELAQSAFSARERGQYPVAIRLFDEALQQGRFGDKERGLILYGRGTSYEALGSRERALADLDASIALFPDYPNAYLYRGIIWGETGQYMRAIQDFLTARKLNPSEPLVFNNLGNVYERLGDLERAIENYGRAIGLSAGDAKAYYNRAHAYFLKQESDLALSDYDKAISLQPNFGDAYVNRAVVRLIRRDLTGALADLDIALQLNPRDLTARFNRATINLGRENYDAALGDFNRALEFSPGNAALYVGRGQTYLYSGAAAASISDFQTAARLRPSSPYPVIWLHIARVHKSEDDHEELSGNIKSIASDAWPSAVLALYLGTQNRESVLAAAEKGNPTEQIQRDCEAKFFLGEFELHNGETRQARASLGEVISMCGPQEGVYSAAIAESKLLPK